MTANDRADDRRDAQDTRDVQDAASAETSQPGSDYGTVGGQDPAVEQVQPDAEGGQATA